MKIKIGSKLLWCNETALETERIIETQDVIHWNNFYEHWNKRHADFEQSSTDKLSPGNGVVRSPGNEIITFALGLDCASSKKMWVNKLYDYKDRRLREWKKCFLIVLFSLARKKILWWEFLISGEYLGNRKAEGCCSNREPLDQIRRVGMFETVSRILKRLYIMIRIIW